MANIYKLTIDDEQIYDIYYSENHAMDNAMLVSMDTGQTVVVWEADVGDLIDLDEVDLESIDLDELAWEKHWTAWV